ncbi:lipid A-modifier LpxR family protein [Phenylobacterium sp.]|uniref:lipid A-modifier LpxR family protein n=1 Tax=Phenylobacterium sp. TaxID=1871053 RepID=UPI00286E40D1|nr:lipid A-modifier LpxR family protein [Phenylobacterium sp.]
MRSMAGLATVFGICGMGSTSAFAQSTPLTLDSGAAQLMNAAFHSRTFAPHDDSSDPIANLLDRETYALAGPVRWDNSQITLADNGVAVDSLRLSVGGAVHAPGGLPINVDHAQFQAQAYEIAVTRDWPDAVSFATERYDVSVTPHAGLGMSSAGGSAEAGAMLTLGQKASDGLKSRLGAMGVRDGAAFGNEGRWYLFAAASGRAVGLNMQRNNGDWNGAGWSTDPSSALIGDAQLGVGWRKGSMQTSFGYIHREVKGQHMVWGQETKDDSMVAFSLSIKPRH